MKLTIVHWQDSIHIINKLYVGDDTLYLST